MGRLPTNEVVPRLRIDQTSRRRRLWVVTLVTFVMCGLIASVGAGVSGADARESGESRESAQAGESGEDPGQIVVVNVAGLLDPVLVNFIEQSLAQAEALDAVGLVLQLDSAGAAVSDDRFVEMVRRLVDSEVPVHVWVGPSGSRAFGAAAELAGVAEVTAMAPGTRLGRTGPQRLPVDEVGPVFGDATDRLADASVSDEQAREAGVLTEFPPVVIELDDRTVEVLGAPTVGDLLVNLDGVVTEEIRIDDQVRRQPVTQVLFTRLSLLDQLAHTVASPEVAYLLLTIALGLLLFEFFTAGIGVAGVVGAGCLVLAGYGLWVLPIEG